MREFLKDHMHSNIYFCPHGFTKKRRRTEFAVLPKLLWADLDKVDPRKIKYKPSVAIESSPGRFVGLWITDKTVSEELNKALTYELGSDKAGWDITQVLRFPNTINYKYSSTPKVRTLWDDGPTYSLSDFKFKKTKEPKGKNELDAHEVFKEYERKMPAWVRRELINGKPVPKKRSEVIWKLEHALLDVGCSRDEAFVLIKSSAWNKFKGRKDEDKQLQRELDKIIEERMDSRVDLDDPDGSYQYLSRSLDEVEIEDINWVWFPYIARGELTILEGDPGLGKSYLAQMVAKHICDGEPLPEVKKGRATGVQGRVAYFDIENSSGTVTKARMTDNKMKNFKNFIQEEQPFSVDDEDARIRVEEALETVKPVMVVFDTLNTYIGRADTHKASETTQAMSWFRLIAKQFDCAVVVLRHLTKGGGKERAIYRGQGSIAFAGLARIVMTVGAHPENEDERLLTVTKINVAKPPRALSFDIRELPPKLNRQDRSRFSWGEFSDYTSDEVLAAPPQTDGREERSQAVEFLKGKLTNGPIEFKSLLSQAEKMSVSERTLRRAADQLGVIRSIQGFGKNKISYWEIEHP